MRNIITYLFIVGLSMQVLGQDYAKDFRNIVEEFKTLKSYSLETKVQIYGKDESTISAFVKSSQYGKHYRIGFSEMIINNKYAISIDHEYKEIRVQKGKDFNYNYKEAKDEIGLDEMEKIIRDSTHVKYLGKTSTYKTYEIYIDKVIDKLIVKIDIKTGFFKEIEYVYRELVEGVTGYKVQYSNFKKNPSLPKSYFSESKIFTLYKDQIKLLPKYKSYSISFID